MFVRCCCNKNPPLIVVAAVLPKVCADTHATGSEHPWRQPHQTSPQFLKRASQAFKRLELWFRANTVTTLVFVEEPRGERESLTPKSIASRQLFGLGRIRYPGRTMLLRPSRGGTTPRPTTRGQRTNIRVTTSIIKLDFLKVLGAVSQNIYCAHDAHACLYRSGSLYQYLIISVYLLIYIDICVHSGRPIDI